MLPIYYINTAARTDRRDHMESLFRQLELKANRFEAVLVRDLPDALLNKYCRADSAIRHGAGHLACSLSHGEVWKTFIASGAEAALIFEDDALLSSDLPEFLRLLGDELPRGVDILKIETYSDMGLRLSTRDTQSLGEFTMSRLLGTHVGACGYIISRRLAERLLEDKHRLDFIIDEYLFGRRSHVVFRHRVYQLLPALAVQISIFRPDEMHTGAAFSDLGLERRDGVQPLVPDSKWTVARRRWRSAAMDLLYFGYDLKGLLGRRHTLRFPTDKVVDALPADLRTGAPSSA